MRRELLNDLADRCESYFKDETQSIIVKKDEAVFNFNDVKMATQFIDENINMKEFSNLKFTQICNLVVVD